MSSTKLPETFILRVYRGTPNNQYWEEFEFELKVGLNIIICLMAIQRNPVNRKGETVVPVAFESGCLEEVCGSCSMLINGVPRQACTAIIEKIILETNSSVISIAPFTKFPLVRDLVVDRSSMFDNLKKVHAWVESSDYTDKGFGPRISQEKQEVMYQLATCMTCGCCTEACPQVNYKTAFVGPQIISQVRLFNLHPIGKLQKSERLHEMMKEGGIEGCSNAQNCKRVCPKKIPLTDSIAQVFHDVNEQAIQDLFGLEDIKEE